MAAPATLSSSSSTRSPHDALSAGGAKVRTRANAEQQHRKHGRPPGVDEHLAEHAPVAELSKYAPGTLGRPIPLGTNAFELSINNDEQMVYLYDVTVTMLRPGVGDAPAKSVDLTGNTAGKDGRYVRNREVCYLTWFTMLRKYEPKFGHPAYYMYDRAKNMYSYTDLERVKGEEVIPHKGRSFAVTLHDIMREAQMEKGEFANRFNITKEATSFVVALQPAHACRKDVQFTACLNMAKETLSTGQLVDRDRTGIAILDLALAQELFISDTFTVFGTGAIYKRDGGVDLGQGVLMRKGFKKSVAITEGRNNQPTLRMLLDAKAGAFFKAAPLDKSIKEMIGMRPRDQLPPVNEQLARRLTSLVKGLEVVVQPTSNVFSVHCVSRTTAKEQTFYWEEAQRSVTVQHYYEKQYNVFLGADASLPCVVQKGRERQLNYYPMSLCHVAPNQRVPNAKQPLEVTQQLIKASALSPAVRLGQIDTALEETSIADSVVLQALGLDLNKNRVQITGRQMPLPSAIYRSAACAGGNNVTTPIGEMASWRTGQSFLRPATLRNWAFVLVTAPNGRPIMGDDEFMQLGRRFMQRARGLGMSLSDPEVALYANRVSDCDASYRDFFSHAVERKLQYVIILTPTASECHGTIKAEEQRSGIVTQHVLHKSAMRIVQRNDNTCLDNYVCKMNTKLGGLCYGIDTTLLKLPKAEFSKGSRMFIGLDVNHAAPVPLHIRARADFKEVEPSVVGFCANIGATCFDFAGDFHYQLPRVEVSDAKTCNIVGELLHALLTKFHAQRANYPTEILLWRDGVSEGMYDKVIKCELRQVRSALKALGCTAKVCIVLVQKRHNVRLFLPEHKISASHKAPEQNVRPGTVVDTDIVHYSFPEFYLHAHKCIQGTGRTPRYTVLVNEPDYSMDTLQAITLGMCYGHGIIASAVSVPAPLYAAHELAKRGKTVLRAYCKERGIDMSAMSSGGGSNSGGNALPHPSILSKELGYGQLDIGKTKYWA